MRKLVVVLLAVFAVLAAQACWRDGFEMGDPVEYANDAWRLVHGLDPDAWTPRGKRPCLMPLILAVPLEVARGAEPVWRLRAMRLGVAVVGTATVAATYALGREVGGTRVGLAAAALLGFNALFSMTCSGLFSEAPCALFVVLALTALLRGHAGRAGLLAGLAVMCRYQALGFLPLMGGWAVVYRGARWSARFAAGVCVALAAQALWDLGVQGRVLGSLRIFLGHELALMNRLAGTTLSSSPWYDYALFAHRWLEKPGPLLVALGLVQARKIAREQACALAVVAFGMVGMLSATAHKELRFLVPVLPQMCVLGALGWHGAAQRGRATAAVATGLLVLAPACGLVRMARQEWHLLYTPQRDAVADIAARRPNAVVLTPTWSLCFAELPAGPRIVSFLPGDPAQIGRVAPTHLVVSEADLKQPGVAAAAQSANLKLARWFESAHQRYALFER